MIDAFDVITETNLALLQEASDADMEKTKSEIERVHKALSDLKIKMHKEREAGKSPTVLDALKKQWQQLQAKIVDIWKSYDQKHGTKYHAAYA
jgi:t-SNARE complex subunit (syntaxin)